MFMKANHMCDLMKLFGLLSSEQWRTQDLSMGAFQ